MFIFLERDEYRHTKIVLRGKWDGLLFGESRSDGIDDSRFIQSAISQHL